MKITIDTKEDSAEEIKKIVGFLNNIVGKEAVSNKNIFEQLDSKDIFEQTKEKPVKENILGNIFEVKDDDEEVQAIKKGPNEEVRIMKPKRAEVQIIY